MMVTRGSGPLPNVRGDDNGGCRTGKMVLNFLVLMFNGPFAGLGGIQGLYPQYFKLMDGPLAFVF
jgi:hypothetical protein